MRTFTLKQHRKHCESERKTSLNSLRASLPALGVNSC